MSDGDCAIAGLSARGGELELMSESVTLFTYVDDFVD